MTSLAAWVAVDSRATSSFYLVSDSRISFAHGKPPFDSARKLFASSRYADLFGYCGDVDFAFSVLDRVLLTNSQFSAGINSGWIGTRGSHSQSIKKVVKQYYGTEHALVVAHESVT
jgi:hypothetical protein